MKQTSVKIDGAEYSLCATTESEILEMATRLASAGKLAGMSEAQILALATAMSSVGIEAGAEAYIKDRLDISA